MNPRSVNKSIIKFDKKAIQETDYIKAIIANKNIKLLEATVLVVLNLI